MHHAVPVTDRGGRSPGHHDEGRKPTQEGHRIPPGLTQQDRLGPHANVCQGHLQAVRFGLRPGLGPRPGLHPGDVSLDHLRHPLLDAPDHDVVGLLVLRALLGHEGSVRGEVIVVLGALALLEPLGPEDRGHHLLERGAVLRDEVDDEGRRILGGDGRLPRWNDLIERLCWCHCGIPILGVIRPLSWPCARASRARRRSGPAFPWCSWAPAPSSSQSARGSSPRPCACQRIDD